MASIFTKIIEGEIPCYKVGENDNNFAFLDINPVAEGHTLVIPKLEVDYIFDLDDQTLAELMLYAKKVATAIDKALSPIRTAIIVEGLEVPHAHIHLVPIYTERQEIKLGNSIDVSESKMNEIASKIAGAIQ
jgi:histidine triad (HIT) family protein